jgi:hypothetical protein
MRQQKFSVYFSMEDSDLSREISRAKRTPSGESFEETTDNLK